MLLKVRGKVVGGEFVPYFKEHQQHQLEKLEGKHATATYSEAKKQRTNPQNRYLHGVVFALIADETGNDPDDVKTFLKGKFLTERLDGPVTSRVKSTSELSTKEMNMFVEECCRWAMMFLGVIIPEPGEVEL
ncbi:hypothetical protein N9104_01670 [Pseudomonadales bacterium]|nr:hypothetical protein [Pseudomonadales bacterium]